MNQPTSTTSPANCPNTSPVPTKQSPLSRSYPWIVIFFSSLFLFYKYVLQISPSVMTNDLMRHFHVHATGLGNLAATFFYAYLIVQVCAGPLLDKYSPRLLTTAAILLSAIGALWFADSKTLWSATLARALIGAAGAFATVSYLKLGAVRFKPEKYALVSGLLATAAMLGSMAAQVPLGALVSHLGWQHALFDCGIGGLVLAIAYYLCVRDRTVPTSQGGQPIASPKLADFVALLKKKHNWLLMIYSGLAFSPLAVFGGLWGNPFLQEAFHLSKANAGILVSCAFFGLALGGPLLGWLAYRLKNRYGVMTGGLVLSFVSLTMALYIPEMASWLEGMLLFAFGFGTGAFMLGFVIGKELNSLLLAGSVTALINSGDALFGAFSEPLAGKVLDLTWEGRVVHGLHYYSVHDYHVALLMLPGYLLLAGFCLFKLYQGQTAR